MARAFVWVPLASAAASVLAPLLLPRPTPPRVIGCPVVAVRSPGRPLCPVSRLQSPSLVLAAPHAKLVMRTASQLLGLLVLQGPAVQMVVRQKVAMRKVVTVQGPRPCGHRPAPVRIEVALFRQDREK